jgi:hypothetical protein
MTDPWSWWADKLAGKAVQMNPGNPHAGFYRMPRKAFYGARKTFTPVAYWPGTNGKGEPMMHCRFGDDDVTPERGEEIWERVGNHPVSEQAYRDVAQRNMPWPDEHELVPMGDNLGPEDEDTFEALQDKISNLAREAEQRMDGPAIGDQDEADRIANLSDRLAELWKKSDTLRKAERKPHDEALRAIQLKWVNVLLKAETYKHLKYKLLTPWLTRLQEAQKKEAEAAAAAGEPAAADARRPRAGTRGRAQTLKTFKHAQIEDYEKALTFFKESQDVKDLVQELANRAVRAGITVPGTKVIEEKKAV